MDQLAEVYAKLDPTAQAIVLKAAHETNETQAHRVAVPYLGTHDRRRLRSFLTRLRTMYRANATD